MDYYQVLARRIARLRNKRGYTQKTLAARANITTSYLSKLESAVSIRGVSIQVLADIAKTLNISLPSLLKTTKDDQICSYAYFNAKTQITKNEKFDGDDSLGFFLAEMQESYNPNRQNR